MRWINECFQIIYKLYKKHQTYFFSQRNTNIKMVYFLVNSNYRYNYFNLIIIYIYLFSIKNCTGVP